MGEVKAKAEARAQANPGGTRTGVAVALTLTMENVEDELLKRSAQVPVIVLIGTPRSEDSNRLRTDFTDLAEAGHYSFVFRYADADATPDIARMFGVQGCPPWWPLPPASPSLTSPAANRKKPSPSGLPR